MSTKFRGKKVTYSPVYPMVYEPSHPLAYANGMVYVHRLVAYEKWGDVVKHNHVHHKDGDVDNWNVENLELLSNSQHITYHNTGTTNGHSFVRYCSFCGEKIIVKRIQRQRSKRVFCDRVCSKNATKPTKIEWPSVQEVIGMVKDTNFTQAGRILGVTDNSVRKFLRRKGVDPKTLMPL